MPLGSSSNRYKNVVLKRQTVEAGLPNIEFQ